MKNSWQSHSDALLQNGPDPSFARTASVGPGTRSQDDANVEYFYQRPQADFNQQYQKHWPVGDDSALEHVSKSSIIVNS